MRQLLLDILDDGGLLSVTFVYDYDAYCFEGVSFLNTSSKELEPVDGLWKSTCWPELLEIESY